MLLPLLLTLGFAGCRAARLRGSTLRGDVEYRSAAEAEVERSRAAALKRVQNTHTIDDYCCKTWDYPGKWYYAGFRLPDGFRDQEALIDAIINDTLLYFGEKP